MAKNNKLNEDELLQFVFTPTNCVYMGDQFKVYSGEVDLKKYPQIKTNSYGNVSIAGNIHSLSIGVPHLVTAIEEDGKYGKSYKIHNIMRDEPKDSNAIKNFLEEILTVPQTTSLLEIYPDIINRIRNNEPVDLSKVKGIGEKSFEKIKKNVMDNFVLVELCEYYHGVFSISIMRKLHEKYASVPLLNAKLKTAPYSILLSLAGCGFRTSDELVLKLEEKGILEFDVPVRESKDRAKACLIYLLQENEGNGHTKMSAKELKELSSKLAPACAHHFVDLLMNYEHIYFHKATMDVSLIWTYRTEEYIAKRLKEGLECKDIWDIDCSKYVVDDNGITLTDEQSSGLDVLCKNQIMILEGSSGVGKSSSAFAIIKMLKNNRKSFLLLSPTGRASQVLAEYTKEKTFTIHRGLEYKHPNEWFYNKDNKLPHDVVVVDEFGMVDIFLFKRLLEAIDFNKTKLLIIGDSYQLNSVGAGNILHDLLDSKLIPTVNLTKVFRFGEGGQMTIATKTRLSEKFIDSNETRIMQYGNDKSYVFIPLPQEQLLFKLTQLYDKLLKDGYKPKDIFVLTSYNKGEYGTIRINELLQPLANNTNNKKHYKYGNTNYYEDDLVMQCVNNYKSRVYDIDWDVVTEDKTLITNGEIGVIYKILEQGIVIKFDNYYIYYTNSNLKDLSLGYCASIHKCITEDTYIFTNEGLKQIKDLNNGARILESKTITSEIEVYNGSELEKPSNFYNAGISDCVEIKTKRGYSLTATLDHKIDYLDKDGFIKTKLVSNLTCDDYLIINKNNNIYGSNLELPKEWLDLPELDVRSKVFQLPNKMTKDFARFLGYMVADGNINRGGVALAKRYKEVVVDFKNICHRLFGYEKENILHKDGKAGGFYIWYMSSMQIKNFCKKIEGLQPNDKFVPQCILDSPKEYQCEFLKALFEDGTVNLKKGKFDHIELSMKETKLAKQVQMMLLNMGIIVTHAQYRTQQFLYIYKVDARLFKENIGFISSIKNDRLMLSEDNAPYEQSNTRLPYITNIIKTLKDKYQLIFKDEMTSIQVSISKGRIILSTLNKFLNTYHNKLKDDELFKHLQYISDNVLIEPIKELTPCVEQTYCIEMPKTHKFVQNGILAGNCQGGQSKIVIMITPRSHTFMLNSNLMYVAQTRAKEKVYHFGEPNVVNRAIKKKANLQRATFLLELLNK